MKKKKYKMKGCYRAKDLYLRSERFDLPKFQEVDEAGAGATDVDVSVPPADAGAVGGVAPEMK